MTNFTKLIFCLFTILIIFTSCGDGTTNSGNSDINDNPQFEKSVLDSITVKTLPTKTQYSVGETLDPIGLVLQGNYIDYFSDGSTQTSKRDIDYNTYKNELAFSPTNLSTEGTIKITVTYNKKSTTFNITVGKSSSDSKYPSWFKSVSIGGSDLYQVYYIDDIQYNKDNDFTTEKKVNDYLAAYIDYINGLTLNENLTGNVENNLNNIKNYLTSQKLNLLIGTTANDTGTIYSQINGINDICKQAIEKIAQKTCTSPLNKTVFKFSYKTMHNEVYRKAYELDITSKKTLDGTESSFGEKQYIQTKADCSVHDGKETLPFSNKCFYLESGELNPEVVGYFDEMIEQAAKDLMVDINDLRNIVKLSFTTSAIEGILDLLCPSLNIDPESCKNNEMYDIIDGTNISKTTAKLNKSVFSQDYGRELC